MKRKNRSKDLWNAVRREDGAQYMLIATVSFAASVAIVRGFLDVSGYPQIGGGGLHISHVLWGGLLLFVAALLLLIFDYRPVYVAGSILAGVGFGLFIDEVGKFITSDYNYFFPIAAPIVYIFFLITLFVYLRLRRPQPPDPLNELDESLELLEEDVLHPLGAGKWEELQARLSAAVRGRGGELEGRDVRLAQALLAYTRAEVRPAPAPSRPPAWERIGERFYRWLREGHLRALLVAGLVLLALFVLKNPLEKAPWLPQGMAAFLQNMHMGPEVAPGTAPGLYVFRMVLEVAIGALALISACLLAVKRINAGVAVGYLSLLAALLALDTVVFYFAQFSTILVVAYQFLILLGLLSYRRRFPVSLERAPAYQRNFITWIERGFTLRARKPRRPRR